MGTKNDSLSDSNLQRLVAEQTPMVENIARRMAHRLPSSVETNDLIQDGMLGLVDAILRWTKETTGSHFDNYMAQRAQGAMLDGLRAMDPATRRIRREMRRVEHAIQRLSHSLGRVPLESEVAQALEMTLANYQHLLQEAHDYLLISLEDLGGGDDSDAYFEQCVSNNIAPLVVLERASVRQTLAAAVSALPEQKREVLRCYYEEELKMREVGELLDISESRVSQLLAHSIAQLRSSMMAGDDASHMFKPRVNGTVQDRRGLTRRERRTTPR